METELIVAIIAGLGGMLGWGLADFFAKKVIDKVGDIVTLVWAHLFGTGILFLVIFYQSVLSKHSLQIPHGIHEWILLFFFGVLQAAVYLLVYKGFGKGQVAVLSPIFSSYSGFTAIFSIILFGETINVYFLLGLIPLFAGILLINLDQQAVQTKRIIFSRVPGFVEIAVATVLAIIWTLSWNSFIEGQDWWFDTFAMYVFMTLTILIFAKIRRKKIFKIESSDWKFLLLVGACEIVAYLAISWGYSVTSLTSVVALLSGAFSLPTILLAHLFLREKITLLQIIGIIIIILGIMILSAYSVL